MKIDAVEQINSILIKPYIKRAIHEAFFKSLGYKEVTILYGARQVGKSSEIVNCIATLLLDEEDKDIFYFNLDVQQAELSDPNTFVNYVTAKKTDAGKKTYVFIDEAQRLENIGLFVKYIYDQHLNIKFVLTGSASLDVKQKIKEPLTGRKIEYHLRPLNLNEIVKYRGINTNALSGNFSELEQIIENYLLYGGYPEVVTLKDAEAKKRKLLEITESYILKDVTELFGITNQDNLRLIATYLAENIGNILSKDNMCKFTTFSKHEIDKGITALEKSFVINLIKPFAKHKSKEMTHRPKIYFQDLGIRNAVIKKLESSLIVADKGALFENAVLLELSRFNNAEIYENEIKYWRTNNQTEVDFIVIKEAGKIDAYEVKYTFNKDNIPRNLASFKNLNEKNINTVQVVSKDNLWKLIK